MLNLRNIQFINVKKYGGLELKKKNYKKILFFQILLITACLLILPNFSAYNLIEKSRDNDEDDRLNNYNSYDMIIISPKSFSLSLKPLESFKNNFGVKSVIVNLEHIYSCSENPGRDNAEKIKYFIKEAIENWNIKYVLLVGGLKGQTRDWYLPVRYIHMGNNFESEIISDLYYADVLDSNGNFSSWDSDGDGKFAEWWFGDQPEDVNIDFYPDVSVGRLPCRNVFEVKLMVKKIIGYEKGVNSNDWFQRFLVLAGDTYPELHNPLWVGYEGEYYGNLAIENMTGFSPTRLYTSDGSLSHFEDIIRSFNDGYGFVYFVGHGNPMSWSTHLPNSNKWIKSFENIHIPMLINSNKLPVCVIGGCHNLQFDVTVLNYFDEIKRFRGEYTPECMGWWMARKVGGGSIATLGCTALGYTKEDKLSFKGGTEELEVQFFRQYGSHKIDVLGDAWANAISWYVDTYSVPWENPFLSKDSWIDAQVVQTWVLLGDPSLKIGGYG
jgi:hypothetical protein